MVDGTPGRPVVGHADWSVKNMRFGGGEIRAVYDWDSLRLERETVILGTAAATFTATWYLDVPKAPSPEEARLFVREYEAARGVPFTDGERTAVVAAITYVLAYSARCEHALDAAGEESAGGFREALASHGEEYLLP